MLASFLLCISSHTLHSILVVVFDSRGVEARHVKEKRSTQKVVKTLLAENKYNRSGIIKGCVFKFTADEIMHIC